MTRGSRAHQILDERECCGHDGGFVAMERGGDQERRPLVRIEGTLACNTNDDELTLLERVPRGSHLDRLRGQQRL